MNKSFYHFLLKFRHPQPKDKISQFANDAYFDHDFPKTSAVYEDLTLYLELNGHYLDSMSVFDEAWSLYTISEG